MALALKQKPNWLFQTPLVVAPLPEPHYHLCYTGQAGAGATDEELSDGRLDHLAADGVTLISLPFYRGYGAEFEQVSMDRAAEAAQRVHARGLRIALRLTVGAVTPETLLAEESEAHNWLQVNADGQACVLASTTPGVRVRPCFHSEAYQRYIEKICLRAVESGADLLVLQDLAYNPEPDTCRCPLCVSAFRERLRELYGPQTEETRASGHERFGHHNFAHVRPPLYRSSLTGTPEELNAPHEQEWQLFKTRTLSRFLSRLSKAAERQNAECAIAADVLRPTDAEARAAGLDLPELLPLLDVAPFPSGATVEQQTDRIHAVRQVHTFAVTACLPHGRAADGLACETLALQPQGPLCYACNEEDADVMSFQRAHWDALFKGSREIARIGVFCDPASLQLNSGIPHATRRAMEEFLTDRHLPFALLSPDQLDDLASYACVVVAGAECTDPTSVDRLRAFAEAGGGVVLAGAAGVLDTWRRPRPSSVFSDWFADDASPDARIELGQGRAVRVKDTGDEPALADALRFALGDPIVRVAAQNGRFLLTHYRLPSGAQTLHLLGAPDAAPAGLEFAMNCEQAPQDVTLFAPGCEPQAIAFAFSEAARQLSFRLGSLPRYAVVRMETAG